MSGSARIALPGLLVVLAGAAGCVRAPRGLPPQTGSALYVGPGLNCAEPGQSGQVVVDNRTPDVVEVVRLEGKTGRRTVVGTAPPGRVSFPLPADTTTYATYVPRSNGAPGNAHAGAVAQDPRVTFTLLCTPSGAAAPRDARAGSQR